MNGQASASSVKNPPLRFDGDASAVAACLPPPRSPRPPRPNPCESPPNTLAISVHCLIFRLEMRVWSSALFAFRCYEPHGHTPLPRACSHLQSSVDWLQ